MADVKLAASKILSAAEEKTLDRTIEDLKDMRDGAEINGTQGVNFEVKDKPLIDKKIADLEKIRQNNSLPAVSDVERARAEKELKVLEADLQKDMPTWAEYEGSRPQHGPRHTALVRKIYQWDHDPIRIQKVKRWKFLRRLLDPSDPQASNVMFLFPQG